MFLKVIILHHEVCNKVCFCKKKNMEVDVVVFCSQLGEAEHSSAQQQNTNHQTHIHTSVRRTCCVAFLAT